MRFAAALLMFLLLFSADPATAWWDPAWGARKEVNVSSVYSVENYTMKLNITYEPGMEQDFRDVKFTFFNKTSGTEMEIPYYLSNFTNGSWALFMIKIPLIPSKIFMYFDNPNANYTGDISSVYLFYDDFSDGNWTDSWINYTSDNTHPIVTESGSEILVNTTGGNGVHQGIQTIRNFTAPILVEGKTTRFGEGWAAGVFLVDRDMPTKPNTSFNAVLFSRRSSGGTTSAVHFLNGTSNTIFQVVLGASFPFELGFVNDSGVLWDLNGTRVEISNYTGATTAEYKVRLNGYEGANIGLDWIGVRRYVSPQPVITLSGVQKLPGMSFFISNSYKTCNNLTVYLEIYNVNLNFTVSLSSLSKTCPGNCSVSFLVGSDPSCEILPGNHNLTINATDPNEPCLSLYNITSLYAEDTRTTGEFAAFNVTASNISSVSSVQVPITFFVNNTGKAKMTNAKITKYSGAFSLASEPVFNLSAGSWTNVTVNISIPAGTSSGEYFHVFNLSWTNNDGSSSGNIYASAYVIVPSNPVLELSNYTVEVTVPHNSSRVLKIYVNSTGNDPLTDVYVNSSSSLVSVSPAFIQSIAPGSSTELLINVTVPPFHRPENLTATINVTSGSQKKTVNVSVSIPKDVSWVLEVFSRNGTRVPFINETYGLNEAGPLGNVTVRNTGNVPLNISLTYTSTGANDPISNGVFETDKNVSGTIYNPGSIAASPGETENVPLYQNGFYLALDFHLEVGLVSNESLSSKVNVSWYIIDKPPEITVLSYLEEVEMNRTFSVLSYIYDDQSEVSAFCTFYAPDGSVTNVSASGGPGNGNYTCSFVPVKEGRYRGNVTACDSGKCAFQEISFRSTGTTSVTGSASPLSVSVSGVTFFDPGFFTLNVTLRNTGNVTAYSVNVTVPPPGGTGWTSTKCSLSSLASGSSATCQLNVTVSERTDPGSYTVRPYITWRNPNASVYGYNYTEVISVSVAETRKLEISLDPASLTIPHGSSGTTVLKLNSTGNANVTDINVTCTAEPCSKASLNSTHIPSIPPGKAEYVKIEFVLPEGYPDGTYFPVINASSYSATLQVTVPQNRSWTRNVTGIGLKVYAGKSGSVPIEIKNIGNGQITLSLAFSGNASSFLSFPATLSIDAQKTSVLLLNYTAPNNKSYIEGNLTITGPSESVNIPVNISSYVFSLPILQPERVENATSGSQVNVSFGLFTEENYTEDNVSLSVFVGGSECGISSKKLSGKVWNVSCSLPSLPDGRWYTLKVVATYLPYSLVIENETRSAIHFKDLTPPSSVLVGTENVMVNQSARITVSVTDNSVVSGVRVTVTFPNGSSVTGEAAGIGSSLFEFRTGNLTDPGIYLVEATARDTGNNEATGRSWFRVGTNVSITGNLTDPSGNPINATLRLINPIFSVSEVLLSASGTYSGSAWTGTYHLEVEKPLAFRVRLLNATIPGSLKNPVKVDYLDGSVANLGGVRKLKLLAIEPSVNFSAVEVEFDLIGLTSSFSDYRNLKVFKCPDWIFENRTCPGSWVQVPAIVDTANLKVRVYSDTTSAYLLAESESDSGGTSTVYQTVISGAGTGDIKRIIEEILKKLESKEKLVVRAQSISLEMVQGESTTTRIYVYNNYETELIVKMELSGDASRFLEVKNPEIRIPKRTEGYFEMEVRVPKDVKEGVYYGRAKISGSGFTSTVPITIKVLRKSARLLDLKVQPLQDYAPPGSDLKVEVTVYSMGEGRKVDVNLTLLLIDPDTMVEVSRVTESLAVETSLSRILTVKVPEDIPEKRYLIKAVAKYLDVREMVAESAAYIRVETPLLQRKVLGVSLWAVLLLLSLALTGSATGYWVYRKKKEAEERKRRFKSVVDVKELPEAGEDSLFVGLLAETGIRAFVRANDLKTHVMIAGATGSGKTVAAMVLAEEMLMKGKNVIVFDPTGQWTGFLRKCRERYMLKRYSKFGLKKSDARGFPGKIRIVKSAKERVRLSELIEEGGRIVVFVLNRLEPKEIETFVAATVEEIFRARLEESKDIKALIIYDEVHRLLEKFGGSGSGFLAIERAVREFRKWGIGLGLISQVLSDFVGEIKANIGMEIQMRTRYEGDLQRIKMKYGEDYVSGIVKAGVGTGMIVYSEYNRGRPFFVEFRPLLHQVTRLTDRELEEYDRRSVRIEEMKRVIESAKKRGVDTFDLETEISLAEDKLMEGAFEMVDIYLEGLEPRIRRLMKNEKARGRGRGGKA